MIARSLLVRAKIRREKKALSKMIAGSVEAGRRAYFHSRLAGFLKRLLLRLALVAVKRKIGGHAYSTRKN